MDFFLGQHSMYQLTTRPIATIIVSADVMQGFQQYNGVVDICLH